MSFHSRSSSEVEAIPCNEIIPVFIKDFRKDFDFNDVKHKVRSLFSDIEFDYIVKETGEAQILHLIWILQNKCDVIISQFLDAIKDEYHWIVDKIKREMNNHMSETTRYLEALKSIQRDYQNHTDYNVHRTKQFLKLRYALRKLNPKSGLNSVILLGDLGSGKKWLSLDVISDFDVLKSMNFKVFWIDCSLCTSLYEDYNALKILMIKLNPQYQFDDCKTHENLLPNMILRLKEQIKLILECKEYCNCLLVLANVRSVKCQEAFNLGCKRLIITRNKKVSDSLSPKLNTHLILDDGLRLKEFYLLLDKYITAYNWRIENNDSANDIFYMSNGDPYMLSTIARNLSEKKSNWNEWMRNLNNFQIPDVKFQRDIENSLKVLTPQQLEFYATFAVFQYCAQIPVKLLAYLWNVQLFEAEEIIKKFHLNSFVQKQILEDNDTIVCSLKYVYSSYIKNCYKMQQLINAQELHSRIIEYYQVEDHLNVRKDVDLDFGVHQHDGYFFRWIGYHLYGARYMHLFPKLYKDFGFLGQKMRSVGLNNTLVDLRYYDREISYNDRTYSFKKLKAFLAKIEEKILHYPDCCLLQYALLSDDFIKDLALQQIEKFPRRVWFTERGQYHQRRFTISLPQVPKLLRILEHDLCIVVLENNDIYLMDLSLDSTYNLLKLVESTGMANITDIQIFDNKNHVLIINNFGQLKLWDISIEKRYILNQRRGSDVIYETNYTYSSNKIAARSYKQNINDNIHYFNKIVAFNLVKNDSNEMLYVALDSGFVKFFDWNPKFKEFRETSYHIPLKTDIKRIHSISNIFHTHLMIIDYDQENTMNVTFLKYRNTEKETKRFDWPKNAQLVYHKVCDNVIIYVFNNAVLRLTLSFMPFNGHLEVLYESPNCVINCGKILMDNQYLMLGTEKGLLIYDITNSAVKLHSSVSENISCLDNYDLDDEEFKSMIVCGCNNKNIVYIFGLRLLSDQTLVWEHSCLHRFEELAHLEQHKNTRFLGQTLFDVSEEHETLYAVDLKNRIHQICCAETKNWSIIPSLDVNHKIIAIKCFKKSVFVALENGDVYDVEQQRLVFKATNSMSHKFFLKTIDENILVTSSAKEMTYVMDMANDNKKQEIQVLTKYCTLIMDKYLLIVNNYGAVLFIDCENSFSYVCHIDAYSLLADCDLKDNILFLGFSCYNVHIYSLEKTPSSIDCNKRCEIKENNDLIITCITASINAKLFAIGLNTRSPTNGLRSCGDIEVFRLNDDFKEQLLYCLKSHVRPIHDMIFSPQNDVLVSISEQICFWNINYIVNNPLDVGSKKRHSSRFTSQKSAEEVDFKVVCQQERRDRFLNFDQTKHSISFGNYKLGNNSLEQSTCSDELNDSVFEESIEKVESIWSCLHGPTDKPELFSCLKLDGNEAKQIFANKDFTEFYTIDDEGVYYNLKLIKTSIALTPVDVDTQDSSSSSYNMDYLQLHRLSVTSSTMSGTDVVDNAIT